MFSELTPGIRANIELDDIVRYSKNTMPLRLSAMGSEMQYFLLQESIFWHKDRLTLVEIATYKN